MPDFHRVLEARTAASTSFACARAEHLLCDGRAHDQQPCRCDCHFCVHGVPEAEICPQCELQP